MKFKNLLFALSIISLSSAPAFASCQTTKGQECVQAEKGKSDASRGGAGVYEFCAAQATISCSNDSGNASRTTAKLNDVDKCEELAFQTGNWNKEVYHDCMDTPEGFRW